MYIFNYRHRAQAVFLGFFAFLVFCIGRLFYIQLFHYGYLSSLARKQHNIFVDLEPRRGTIYDINLKPLAVNIAADSVYACPNEIPDKSKEMIIRQLMPILKADYSFLKDRLYRKKSFIWLARKIYPEQSAEIKKLKIKGIDFIKESRRCYPNGYLMSHIIGFAGLDNTGLEATELYYNKYLKGDNGFALFLRDARQKKLDLWEELALPRDGNDLVLTVDETIQFIAERELDKAVKLYHAKAGTIIVMNPYSGAVLALANRPKYDLNEYSKAGKDQLRDRAVCDLFEPGSVFKIVTASAALEENKVSEETRFFCENGAYRVANHTLHDHTSHGWLTFREVVEQSSNIGTVKVAQLIGPDLVYRYAKLYGFGAKTGIDLPGEISGMLKEPRFWSKVSIAAIPIGQEVGVTAIQLASAVSVIANGGVMVKPYIVDEIKDKYGQSLKKFEPVAVRRVVSVRTAERLRQMLQGVIERGTGKFARLNGYTAGGKTGTAQKLEPNGAYSHNKFIGSFVGFAPAESPAIVIVVTLDEPHPYYGGVVAAPVFKNVANDVLRYLSSNVAAEIAALNN